MPPRKKHQSARAGRQKAATRATLTVAQPVDRRSWTVDALRDELADRGLATSGRKPELVQRLLDADHQVPPLPEGVDWHERTVRWWAGIWSSLRTCRLSRFCIRA